MKQVFLYDTTLRDGSQGEGISFSATDKLRIAEKLDEVGIHYIEGGWPGSNPKDMDFFKNVKKLKLKKSKIAAFGSTCRAHTRAKDDFNIKGLLKANTPVVTIFGKSWDLHVKKVFKVALEENLRMIEDSVSFLKKKTDQVIFDAEHFFDGYCANPDYAIKALQAAASGGCDRIALCDTNGGMLTSEIFRIVDEVGKKIKTPLGIHVHNDSGLGVANSIAAVQAGCVSVQGTFNGYGERCGNANLTTIIPILQLKLHAKCISPLALRRLTETSVFIADICNMKHISSYPFVGASAFAHKAGVHVNAVMKNAITYEHIDPALVGNRRRFLVSELSGKSTILSKAGVMGIDTGKIQDHTKKILSLIQDREYEGYHYESADASLQLLVKKAVGEFTSFFQIEEFRSIVEKTGEELSSEAIVKVKIGDKTQHTVASGDGPVNALDGALRKALREFFPTLKDIHLCDYKVVVLNEQDATAAKVRVLIRTQDQTGSWWTIGVSENIIEASMIALLDSIEFKLLRDKTAKRKKSKKR